MVPEEMNVEKIDARVGQRVSLLAIFSSSLVNLSGPGCLLFQRSLRIVSTSSGGFLAQILIFATDFGSGLNKTFVVLKVVRVVFPAKGSWFV